MDRIASSLLTGLQQVFGFYAFLVIYVTCLYVPSVFLAAPAKSSRRSATLVSSPQRFHSDYQSSLSVAFPHTRCLTSSSVAVMQPPRLREQPRMSYQATPSFSSPVVASQPIPSSPSASQPSSSSSFSTSRADVDAVAESLSSMKGLSSDTTSIDELFACLTVSVSEVSPYSSSTFFFK